MNLLTSTNRYSRIQLFAKETCSSPTFAVFPLVCTTIQEAIPFVFSITITIFKVWRNCCSFNIISNLPTVFSPYKSFRSMIFAIQVDPIGWLWIPEMQEKFLSFWCTLLIQSLLHNSIILCHAVTLIWHSLGNRPGFQVGASPRHGSYTAAPRSLLSLPVPHTRRPLRCSPGPLRMGHRAILDGTTNSTNVGSLTLTVLLKVWWNLGIRYKKL